MHGDATAYRRLIANVYELAGVSRRLSDREAVSLNSSVARWHVLSVVSEAPATVPAIARRLGHQRQPVQRVVDVLERDGCVRRLPNPAHARSSLVELAATGRRELDDLWAVSTPRREALLTRAGLTDSDIEAADQVLRRLLTVMCDA